MCSLIVQCYQEEENRRSKINIKKSKEEKQEIYSRPLEKQFEELEKGRSGGSLSCHILKDDTAMDYERVKRAAVLYADKDNVLMLPEIHISESKIRNELGLPPKSNPDIKKGNVFIDVKSPFSTSNIVNNANDASQQGAIACITDDHCIIHESSIINFAKRILDNKYYLFDEVHFVVNGQLYKITTADV